MCVLLTQGNWLIGHRQDARLAVQFSKLMVHPSPPCSNTLSKMLWVSSGVTKAVCILEAGAADAHVLGGKFISLRLFVVCQLVDVEASNRWFICLLLFDLSIKVSDDDLHVMFWAAVLPPLQLASRIEGLFLVIGAPKVRLCPLRKAIENVSTSRSR